MSELAIHRMRELESGYRLGRFVILCVLGQGEYGITYKAHDTSLDREVAIKEYFPSAIAYRDNDSNLRTHASRDIGRYKNGLKTFVDRAKAFVKVKHSNIVQVQSVVEKNRTAYMVMDLEEGEDLLQFISIVGTLDHLSQQKIFFPIISGLSIIHRLGFIHGDIKPSNILIRRNGSGILMVSSSILIGSSVISRKMIAHRSEGYAPVEQFGSDTNHLGPWTDIYSLAATMYHGVTGFKPEGSISRSERVLQGYNDTVMMPTKSVSTLYGKGFLDAIERGLSLDPMRRPRELRAWSSLLSSNELQTKDSNSYANSLPPTINNYAVSNMAVQAWPEVDLDVFKSGNSSPPSQTPHYENEYSVSAFRGQKDGKLRYPDVVTKIRKNNRTPRLIAAAIVINILFAIAAVYYLFNIDDSDKYENLVVHDVSTAYGVSTPTANEQNIKITVKEVGNTDLGNNEATGSAELLHHKNVLDAQSKNTESLNLESKKVTIALAEVNKTVSNTLEQKIISLEDNIPYSVTEYKSENSLTGSDAITEDNATGKTSNTRVSFKANEGIPTQIQDNPAWAVNKELPDTQGQINFESQLAGDVLSTNPRSISELIETYPIYPHELDLDISVWGKKKCSNCHNFTPDSLCKQGQIYVAGDEALVTRLKHPYGGFFKKALKEWAIAECL